MKQQELTFPAWCDVDLPRGATLQQRFEAFHRANPWVFDEVIRLLEEARDDGARRIGVKHVFEVLRWKHRRRTRGDDWRLNNSFTSRYARLVAAVRPDLAGLLEFRVLRSD